MDLNRSTNNLLGELIDFRIHGSFSVDSVSELSALCGNTQKFGLCAAQSCAVS